MRNELKIKKASSSVATIELGPMSSKGYISIYCISSDDGKHDKGYCLEHCNGHEGFTTQRLVWDYEDMCDVIFAQLAEHIDNADGETKV